MGFFSAIFGIVMLGIISDTITKVLKARGAAAPRELAALRQQLDEQAQVLDQQAQQLLELQERTDFMERLLAKTREGTAINPPADYDPS